MKTIEKFIPRPIPDKDQTETISVAVAVYNSEAYLDRAIQSLLNQTYKNLEIILVDDGSTDSCPEICDKYAQLDSRVQVIHKKNQGLYSTRNVGIEAATGTYLAFLDGDDWVDENMYESMLSAMKEHQCDFCVCRYKWVYQDGTVDISTDRADLMSGMELLERLVEEDEDYCIQNAAWNKLYKRSILGDWRFPERWYEDVLYTTGLLPRVTSGIYLDRAYHNYVCDRSDSIMNKGINPRIFTDLIPNFYDKSSVLREMGREDLALTHDFYMYKRMLIYYNQTVRGKDPLKKEHKAFLKEKIFSHKNEMEKIFTSPKANANQWKRMQIFLISPALYSVVMELNDRFVIPLKVMISEKRKTS